MAGIHETAARGFARGAEEYEKGRPSYPPDAVALLVAELGIGPGATVVDVGAGTGKFTRLLVPTGASIVAVEPVAEMRDVFRRAVGGVEVRDGTAEALPVEDGSVDAVVAAQVFHWVDAVPAVAELHRVLRAGGGVGMLWNTRDESEGWTARITALMAEVSGGAPRYGTAANGGWQAAAAAHGGFTAIAQRVFRLEHPTTREATTARVASTSYVAALPDDRRREVLAAVETIVAPLGDRFVEPYRTEVYWCHKRT